MKDIEKHVRIIAADLSNGIELNTDDHQHIMDETEQEPGDMMYTSDYLSDALDIEYIISSSGDYLGARVLVAFGGPNIWINTRTMQVEGYWWNDSAFASFDDEIGIDDFLSEMYACL